MGEGQGHWTEASTFALLHPGYCPIDVRRINKECNKGWSLGAQDSHRLYADIAWILYSGGRALAYP